MPRLSFIMQREHTVIQEHVSLKQFNTFGIDVQARYYTRIHDIRQLQQLLRHPKLKSLPRLMLGGGSNVLFVNDFQGIVFHIAIGGISVIREDSEHVWVKAGAGVNWHQLVLHCVEKGYAGIENLALIPGTVGAAPVQNIGAYGVTLSEVFASLEAMEVHSGVIHNFSNQDCAFGYRDSVFKSALKGQYVITTVTLKLHKRPRLLITYGELQETLNTMNSQELSIKAISDAIIQIRRKKLPDPKHVGNAGSFFQNPTILQEQFTQYRHSYPDMPGYIQPEGYVKIPAAWLIEQCGWKGQKRGAIGIHKQHALVLVNYGNGTGKAIYQLARDIQQSVQQRFHIAITPEVRVIG